MYYFICLHTPHPSHTTTICTGIQSKSPTCFYTRTCLKHSMRFTLHIKMSYRPYSVSHCPYELLILLCALSLLHHDWLYVTLFLCHPSQKHERLPMISANALLKVANFPLKIVGVFLWGFTCLWQCWSWLILQSTHKSFSITGLSLHSHLWYTHGVFLAHMCCSLPLMDIMPACYSWLIVSSI